MSDREDHLLSQHIHRQVRFFFDKFLREFWAFAEFVAYHLLHLNQFPFLEVIENFSFWVRPSTLNNQ